MCAVSGCVCDVHGVIVIRLRAVVVVTHDAMITQKARLSLIPRRVASSG
jgi:hypothetical protein